MIKFPVGKSTMKKTIIGGVAVLAATVSAASTASANPGGYSGSDDGYYRSLTTGENAITVTNFPLLIAQGQEACDRMARGASALDAIHALMAEGPYSFGTANRIVGAAGMNYCFEDADRGLRRDHRRLWPGED